MSHHIVHVAVPVPLRQIFDYLAPAAMLTSLQPGVRVRVSFGRRSLIGVVCDIHNTSTLPQGHLKLIEEVLDQEPALTPALFKLAQFASTYYFHPIGEVLAQALPVALRHGDPVEAEPDLRWRPTPLGMLLAKESLQRAPRQMAALQLLRDDPQGISREFAQVFGVTTRDLATLVKRGWAEVYEHEEPQGLPSAQLAQPALPASQEQKLAIERVLNTTGFQTFLLEGITGSGKTEVYLQIIAEVLQRGRQALVLVPEISLTPQTVARFQHRFRCPVVSLHSGLSDKERMNAWRRARHGQAGIIIGTRSALFTPMRHPGIIILDEEHDASFKQAEGFKYHARDLAIVRARIENIPILLGSATPSLESLHNALRSRYVHLRLKQRSNHASLPVFHRVDLRQKKLDEGLAPETLERIQRHLKQNRQVLVFVNRRGYAPVILCHDCGWRVPCPHCSTLPTLHKAEACILCHHCGFRQPIPLRCTSCGSRDLRPLGVGTERLQGVLERHFPNFPLWRIDRDAVRNQRALQKVMDDVHRNEPGLLLGTQMLAKGHHFAAVGLVVIVDADSGLFSADFRGPERCVQMIEQVAGRAGRAGQAGEVLLQTHEPEHPLLTTLLTQGYSALARQLLEERRSLQLPPWSYQALLHAQSNQREATLEFLKQVHDITTEASPYGPIMAPIEKKAGLFRAHLLLQSTKRADLHTALERLNGPDAPLLPDRVRWWLDVDPQDLL